MSSMSAVIAVFFCAADSFSLRRNSSNDSPGAGSVAFSAAQSADAPPSAGATPAFDRDCDGNGSAAAPSVSKATGARSVLTTGFNTGRTIPANITPATASASPEQPSNNIQSCTCLYRVVEPDHGFKDIGDAPRVLGYQKANERNLVVISVGGVKHVRGNR